MPPVIDYSKCVGCGICVDICPMQIFTCTSDTDKHPVITFPKECWHCNSCVDDCPNDAIRLRIPLPFMMLYEERKNLR